MRYFDSALLLKLYVNEPNAARAVDLVGSSRPPMTGLHRLEIKAALAQKLGRREITQAEHDEAKANFENDLATGVFIKMASPWDEVFAKAEALVDSFTAATLCRSLDVLHGVAIAMRATEFCTFDKRRSAMATAAGLAVVS